EQREFLVDEEVVLVHLPLFANVGGGPEAQLHVGVVSGCLPLCHVAQRQREAVDAAGPRCYHEPERDGSLTARPTLLDMFPRSGTPRPGAKKRKRSGIV